MGTGGANFLLLIPKNMNFAVAGFNCENVAVQLHIAAHAFIVDVIYNIVQNSRDIRGVLRKLLRVIG